MSLASSCLPRKISLPESDRSIRLGVPSVRQVVEIIHVLQHLQDEDDRSLLFELLNGLDWSGAIDINIQLKRLYNNNRQDFAEFVQSILMQGYDPEEQAKKAKDDDSDSRSVDDNWKLLVALYCRTLGGDAFEVYERTPFPFFMEMLPEARKEEAKSHIQAALENSFAMGSNKEMMESWQKQAGYKTKQESDAENITDVTEKQMKRNAEVLKNLKEKRNN